MKSNELQVAFVIGSPRSGTTILGEILEAHPDMAHLYEPYYIWYYHSTDRSTDYIDPHDIGEKQQRWIRRRFESFASGERKMRIVDKSPEHSFNVPILLSVFPRAKIIHIVRDGRDVALSIKKEWLKREAIVAKRDYRGLIRTAARMMKRNPQWRFRALALWYELKTNFSWDPRRYLNKSKWEGRAGWGPRFKGWREALDTQTLIQFHAMQWLNCVRQIQQDRHLVPAENWLEIRYEDLVSERHGSLIGEVAEFLDIPMSDEYLSRIPPLRLGNTRKWREELSQTEIDEIAPVLEEKLGELGYLESGQTNGG